MFCEKTVNENQSACPPVDKHENIPLLLNEYSISCNVRWQHVNTFDAEGKAISWKFYAIFSNNVGHVARLIRSLMEQDNQEHSEQENPNPDGGDDEVYEGDPDEPEDS